jgi:hypothetical protein
MRSTDCRVGPQVWFHATIVVVGGAIALTLLWLFMPHTPVGVAIDAILTLVVVFEGVFWALSDGIPTRPARPCRCGRRARVSVSPRAALICQRSSARPSVVQRTSGRR